MIITFQNHLSRTNHCGFKWSNSQFLEKQDIRADLWSVAEQTQNKSLDVTLDCRNVRVSLRSPECEFTCTETPVKYRPVDASWYIRGRQIWKGLRAEEIRQLWSVSSLSPSPHFFIFTIDLIRIVQVTDPVPAFRVRLWWHFCFQSLSHAWFYWTTIPVHQVYQTQHTFFFFGECSVHPNVLACTVPNYPIITV